MTELYRNAALQLVTLVAFGVYLFFYMWLFLCCLGSLKETRAIEKGLGVNFNQEMKA